MPQTMTVTAPNGKTLEITGERVPTESELHDIFKQAGVDTESQSAESKSEPFVPKTAGEFVRRMGNAALDVPIGAAKNLGRAVEMVPGFAEGTDLMFGLPAGASRQAMQPSNPTQTAGGYVGDAALLAATGGAEAGAPILSKTAGYISNPTVAERGLEAAKGAASFGADTVAAVRSQLTSGGPITADKVGGLIVKYGKEAVKLALVGIGGGAGYEAWRAVRHLF